MSIEPKNRSLPIDRRGFVKLAVGTLGALGASAAGLSLGLRERREGWEPLTIEVAGKSISETNPDNAWIYWRIENPNDQPLGYGIEFLEEGRIDLPEEDLADLPVFEGVELTLSKDGSFTLRRKEVPCDEAPTTFGHLSMVPARGSVVVIYPPVLGGNQKASVNIKEDCGLQTFWGYRPTNELVLLGHELDRNGRDLLVTVGATDKLEGKAFAQIQVVLLNKSGEVVNIRHTIAGEVERLTDGEKTTVPVLNMDKVVFTSYEVNILGLTAP